VPTPALLLQRISTLATVTTQPDAVYVLPLTPYVPMGAGYPPTDAPTGPKFVPASTTTDPPAVPISDPPPTAITTDAMDGAAYDVVTDAPDSTLL
jgi:hypothetical protein